jgi:4-alpha-glucanotransferase
VTATERASGILLHITSLPSSYGIGDLGPSSHSFVDLLSKAKQRYWHILPLTPTSLQNGNSPYQPTSAFAGNPLIISPDPLVEDGLLTDDYVKTLRLPNGKVNFKEVTKKKTAMLKKAYESFARVAAASSGGFNEFCAENADWLDDYALFEALKGKTAKPWNLWPTQIRDRDPDALKRVAEDLKDLVGLEKFVQYVFFGQLKALKRHCHSRNIRLVGDVPFYMSYDSCDVWVHSELFKLGKQKHARFVGGVPPDYFSSNGQLWGNPVYDWPQMQRTSLTWWISRIRRSIRFIDVLRLDHFRGFTSYWQIPAFAKTAKKGRWTKASPKEFFAALKSCFPHLPFIAEDLGLITDDVRENLKHLGIPGMRVMIFAFDGSADNPNLPENHVENCVVFTGTHDTNTVKGWFINELGTEQKEIVYRQLGKHVSEKEISREITKLALGSKAKLCLVPIQDVLSLGSDARMNCPARHRHNWEWRVTLDELASKEIGEFGEMSSYFGRD